MEVYLYCSYAHSAKGFFLTRAEPDAVVPCDTGCPALIDEFFSYERYCFLWSDLLVPGPGKEPVFHGGVCGLRGLCGTLQDQRSAYINIAFLASPAEQALLRGVALSILGDYDAFVGQLFAWMRADGSCSYAFDCPALFSWLETLGDKRKLRFSKKRGDPAVHLITKVLKKPRPANGSAQQHLAGITCAWDMLPESREQRTLWRKIPFHVLEKSAFLSVFSGRGTLWKLV